MKRVLVIGNSGSGKTTFSKALADALQIPLVHLDKLYWYGEWEHRSHDEFDTLLLEKLEKDSWIIDGNFTRTIPKRLQYCDAVFFFDLPVITCLWGAVCRAFENRGRSRDDMGGNCPEHLFDKRKLELYKAILDYNKRNRAKIYVLLGQRKNIEVIVFKNRRQVKMFLHNIKSRRSED